MVLTLYRGEESTFMFVESRPRLQLPQPAETSMVSGRDSCDFYG